jgi:endonuclease YncB( thermonuclease family)
MDEPVTSRLSRVVLSLALATLVIALADALLVSTAPAQITPVVYRVDHVADGDTIGLTDGQRVRLVQIDTPEVYFGAECYGEPASAVTKRLLPSGTAVTLRPEPETDLVDQYGRLLRYVIRVRDGLNVNVRLVAVGAAAPYFYRGRRGRYASELEALALSARKRHLGLWGACPHTRYDPDARVATLR